MFKIFNTFFIISLISLTGCSSAKNLSGSEVENAVKSWMTDSGNEVKKVNLDKCVSYNPYENGVNGEDSQENYRSWLCNFTAEIHVQNTKKDITLPFSGCFRGSPLGGRKEIGLRGLWGQQPLPETINEYCIGETEGIQGWAMKDRLSFIEFPNKSFKGDCDNKDKVCLCVKDTMEQEFGKEFLDSLQPYREADLLPRILALNVKNYNGRCSAEVDSPPSQEQVKLQQEGNNSNDLVIGSDEPINTNSNEPNPILESTGNCAELNDTAQSRAASAYSMLSGKVIQKGRLYLYSAPNEQCQTKTFIINNDNIVIHSSYDGYDNITYTNPKTNKEFTGWVKQEGIESIESN